MRKLNKHNAKITAEETAEAAADAPVRTGPEVAGKRRGLKLVECGQKWMPNEQTKRIDARIAAEEAADAAAVTAAIEQMPGINDGDTLHLVDPPPSGKQIFVKTPTGKTLTIDVDVSDTMDNVKRKIAKMEGVDAMVLSLHLEDGKNFCDYIAPGSVYVVYMLPAYSIDPPEPVDFGRI